MFNLFRRRKSSDYANKPSPETIREKINNITNLSESISQIKTSDTRDRKALMSISDNVRILNTLSSDFLVPEEALDAIKDCINGAIQRPYCIVSLAKRIEQLVDSYATKNASYDSALEEERNNDLNAAIEVAIEEREAKKYSDEMDRLANESMKYSHDSMEYRRINIEFQIAQESYKSCCDSMLNLLDAIKANAYINGDRKLKDSYEKSKKYTILSLDKYANLVETCQVLKEEHESNVSEFDSLHGSLSSRSKAPEENSAVTDYLYKTTLEKMDNASLDKIEEELEEKSNSEVLDMLSESKKILEELKKAKKTDTKRFKVLRKKVDRIYQDVYLDRETNGDLEKMVNYHLSSRPKDFQAAETKVRSCIENYCKFKLGGDLSNRWLYAPAKSIVRLFELFGIPSEDVQYLATLYGRCNPSVHTNVEEMCLMSDSQRERLIREGVRFIKDHGYDDYDIYAGSKDLFISLDNKLKEYLDHDRDVTNTTRVDSNNKFRFDKLRYLVSSQIKRVNMLRNNQVSIPETNFDYSSEDALVSSIVNYASERDTNDEFYTRNLTR